MPFITIDAVEGRTQPEVTTLLDAVHRAVVKAFHVPVRDRYQVYQAQWVGEILTQVPTGFPGVVSKGSVIRAPAESTR